VWSEVVKPTLAEVIVHGHTEEALRLIRAGANVNAPEDVDGPLQFAACSHKQGMEEVFKLLIERGAEINHRGRGGFTPLMEACDTAQLESVKYMISMRADVRQKDDSGTTALEVIAGAIDVIPGERADQIITLLVEHGADVNAKDDQGNTPLDQAREEAAKGNLFEGDHRVETLLKFGAKSGKD
jgi:cytohesin